MKKTTQKYILMCVITVLLNPATRVHAQVINSKVYFDNLRLADSTYQLKDYKSSIKYAEKALLINTSDINLYNIACYYSLLGIKDSAFYYLDKSLINTWNNCYWVNFDSELENLRSDLRWESILKKCDQSKNKTDTIDTILQEKMFKMKYEDQIHRKKVDSILHKFGDNSLQMDSLRSVIDKVDKYNLKRLKKIIKKRGLPGKNLVGRAYSTTFLIIQHADVKTQLKYYKLFEKECNKGEMPKKYLAFLTDRILMNQEKKQLFGTQLRWNKEIENYELYPVLDNVNLEVRRKDYGLISIHKYLSRYGIKWKK